MSGIRDRLQRMKKSSGQSNSSNAAKNSDEPYSSNESMNSDEPYSSNGWNNAHEPERQQAAEARNPSGYEEGWQTFNARLAGNDWGSFIMRELKYPLKFVHGKYSLGDWTHERDWLSLLSSNGPHAVDHRRVLFFDTETTGLGIGAGNVPFMIGIGFYEEQHFTVQQMFIRNPGEERAMLVHLQELLQRMTHLVSYNGKTFDWPIIKNRYVLNRLDFQDEELIHLDFLYPSRSLWKNTLSSCRLSHVENQRLGLERVEDVPGSLAPSLYFQYLAERNPSIVEPVFRHNESDILSLAGLAVHFSQLLQGLIKPEEMDAEEAFRLGLWFDRVGKEQLADHAMEHVIGLPTMQSKAYYGRIASFYKKKGCFSRAVPLWQRSIEVDSGTGGSGLTISLEPFIELAMYYEHREKDYGKALHYAEEALNRAWKRISMSRRDPKQRAQYEELQKRTERLMKKKASQSNHSIYDDYDVLGGALDS